MTKVFVVEQRRVMQMIRAEVMSDRPSKNQFPN
jgi:hypothetical protein